MQREQDGRTAWHSVRVRWLHVIGISFRKLHHHRVQFTNLHLPNSEQDFRFSLQSSVLSLQTVATFFKLCNAFTFHSQGPKQGALSGSFNNIGSEQGGWWVGESGSRKVGGGTISYSNSVNHLQLQPRVSHSCVKLKFVLLLILFRCFTRILFSSSTEKKIVLKYFVQFIINKKIIMHY